jgi:D-alanyl-D-alanine carboxypeptidase
VRRVPVPSRAAIPQVAEGSATAGDGVQRPPFVTASATPSWPAQTTPERTAEPSAPRHVPGAAPVVRAGSFHIQVGAFQSAAEAERQLASVRERAASLGKYAPMTQQVKQGDKVFYRARYAGFEAQGTAAEACNELKRLKVDCLVLKAE